MTHLTTAPLSLEPLLAEASAPHCGGTCIFLGTVRDGPEDGGVTAIEYSAYDAMAEAELERIVSETRRQWTDARVAVRHRLGLVSAEEASIAIVVATPHRADAFAACRYVITVAAPTGSTATTCLKGWIGLSRWTFTCRVAPPVPKP